MKINELRIGNKVYNENNQVVDIDVSRLSLLERGKCKYSPIELTREWLTDFGFIKLPESEYTLNTYELDGFQLWDKNGDFSDVVYAGLTKIKSIHHLQNLFFLLKGKELQLK